MKTIGQLMTHGVHTVHHQVPMRVCLKTMRDGGFRHLPVLDDDDRVLGLVSDFDVARACRQGQSLGWVAEAVHQEGIHVTPESPATMVLARMLKARRDCVVVVDAVGDPVGLFTEQDALELAKVAVRPWMTVGERMTSGELFSVSPGTPANRAEDLLYDHVVRHLLVLEDGRLQGVVSHRDLVGRKLPVGKLVRDPVHVVTEETTVGAAAERMLDHGIGCLPVVREDRVPVGVLTRTDILHALARQLVESSVPSADRRP